MSSLWKGRAEDRRVTESHGTFLHRSFVPLRLCQSEHCHVHDLQVGDVSADLSAAPTDLLLGPDGFVYICLGQRDDLTRELDQAVGSA